MYADRQSPLGYSLLLALLLLHLAAMSGALEPALGTSSSSASCPAQRLYPDLLYCLFSFFDFKALLPLYASCRSWRDALIRQPCRQVVLAWPLSSMSSFHRSPLRHHACTYDGSGSVQDLALLNALPSLTAIRGRLDPASFLSLVRQSSGGGIPRDAAISSLFARGWPLKLRSLELELAEASQMLDPRREMPLIVQAVVDCAARYATISELKLVLPQRPVTLQPLLQLSDRLTHLDIEGPTITLKDMDTLKFLTRLERLGFNQGDVSVEMMRAFCSGPQQKGQLHSLRLANTNCTVEHMACLRRLPNLTALAPNRLTLEALPMLSSLPNLQELSLSITHGVSASVFLPRLCECAHLVDLSLWHCQLTQVEVAQLVTGLTRLEMLCFRSVTFVDEHDPGLSLLRELTHLQFLSIYHCEGIRLAQLIDDGLASMRNLHHLVATFSAAELPAAQKLFRIPSRIMPFLKGSTISLEMAQ